MDFAPVAVAGWGSHCDGAMARRHGKTQAEPLRAGAADCLGADQFRLQRGRSTSHTILIANTLLEKELASFLSSILSVNEDSSLPIIPVRRSHRHLLLAVLVSVAHAGKRSSKLEITVINSLMQAAVVIQPEPRAAGPGCRGWSPPATCRTCCRRFGRRRPGPPCECCGPPRRSGSQPGGRPNCFPSGHRRLRSHRTSPQAFVHISSKK